MHKIKIKHKYNIYVYYFITLPQGKNSSINIYNYKLEACCNMIVGWSNIQTCCISSSFSAWIHGILKLV